MRYDIHGCVEGEEEEEEDERKMERRVCPIKSASNVRCSRERLHKKKKLQSTQIGERKLSIDIYSSVRDIRMKGR